MVTIRYSVPVSWYEGVYHDRKSPCTAGRSFSMTHEEKSSVAVLLVHGYAGYPGELVRPSRDLYALGYDIFVPRLPGAGTCGDDFSHSRRDDWVGVAVNALSDLNERYSHVYLLGHSMGASVALVAASRVGAERIVLASPAVGYPGMKSPKPLWQIYLFSLFRKRIPTPWHHQSEYVMYYENAPEDDDYLGGEYWSWVYMRELYELYKLMEEAEKVQKSISVPILAISAGKDQITGEKPAQFIASSAKSGRKHIHIPECTHFLFYDPDKSGEEKAVNAVIDFLS